MAPRTAEFAVIDVVAQPHPEGVYRSIFEAAVGVGVKFYGDYYAALTPISSTRDNIFTGRLATWMAVDEKSKVLNLEDFVETPLSESSDIIIPPGRGLNSRVFEFAFNTKSHKLYLQLKNDSRQSIAPARAEAALRAIFEQVEISGVEEIRVQIVPTSDSVEKVVNLPGLSQITIVLYRPNPTDVSDAANALLEELMMQNAKEEVTTIKKAAGFTSLVLNAYNQAKAQAAAFSGFVKGRGKNEQGQVVQLSTRDQPLIIRHEVVDSESDFTGVRAVAAE